MRTDRIEVFIGDEIQVCRPGVEFSPITVREDADIIIRVWFDGIEDLTQRPIIKAYLEDYAPPNEDTSNLEGIGWDHHAQGEFVALSYTALKGKYFSQCFGMAVVRIYIDSEEHLIPFNVLAKTVTAQNVERMIRYLSIKREHIIRLCLSRTSRPAGVKHEGQSDPEAIVSAAERIIGFFESNLSELRRHIRTKLVPSKVPAWKAAKSGTLIDPVDVLLNLDSLRPEDGGEQEVMLRGKRYSASAIDVTALVREANVQENIILIGGLYSILRIVRSLVEEINTDFQGLSIASNDTEYQDLRYVLFKVSKDAMLHRSEIIIASAQRLIRMLERDYGIRFAGEVIPRISPYVRSSRIYRGIFEQYAQWYQLGSPSLDGLNFLIKLRSLSKIFEFYVLFRLIDYLYDAAWTVTDFSLNEELDSLAPKSMSFERNNIGLILSYEPEIRKFSKVTQHMDLIKVDDPAHPAPFWTPDYTVRLYHKVSRKTRYLILDAKYQPFYNVRKYALSDLRHKYSLLTAVFDRERNILSNQEVMGVFAIFPENLNGRSDLVSILGQSKFAINGSGPMLMPMISGLPVSFDSDMLMERWFDDALNIVMHSLDGTGGLQSVSARVAEPVILSAAYH